jgi:lysophospholipase L1-like esterase
MRRRVLIGGGLLVGLVLAEGVCRLTFPNPITGEPDEERNTWRLEGLVADEELEFSFEPGYSGRMTLAGDYDVSFGINGQGLRADGDFAPRHPDGRRILLVGDSFVFGIGVELQDTLGEQLERALNTDGAGGPPVEVVAAGVPSYGLDHYAGLIERWVPRLQPDLVLVALFPGNDLLDYELSRHDRKVVIEGMLVKQRQAWSFNLRKYSALAHLLLKRFNPHDRVDRARPLKPTPEDIAHIFRTIQPWVGRIVAAPGRDGPPLAIVVIESKGMIAAQQAGRLGFTIPPLADVLAEFREAGCQVLDPVDAWVAAPPPLEQYFFVKDVHYSAAGNRFVAQWLAPRLREAFGDRLRAPAGPSPGAGGDAGSR